MNNDLKVPAEAGKVPVAVRLTIHWINWRVRVNRRRAARRIKAFKRWRELQRDTEATLVKVVYQRKLRGE